MKFLCFGVGAVGTYVGGSLLLAGHEVTYVDRPEIARLVGEHGINLVIKGERIKIHPINVLASIQQALVGNKFDTSILAIKSYDTTQLIHELCEISRHVPPILCLQNGVDNEDKLRIAFDASGVIAGTVTTAIERRESGEIVLQKKRGIGISSGHELSENLVKAFNQAGLNAQLFANADGMKWSKLLTNLLANASSAILDMSPKEIFAHHGLYRLEIQQLREAMQVMAAKQIPIVNLPGTPVWWLGWAVKNLPFWASQPLLSGLLGKGRGNKMPSLHMDLHSGRMNSEVDYLNGAVTRAGFQSGVCTPINQSLNTILQQIVRREVDPSEYIHNPGKLLSAIYS